MTLMARALTRMAIVALAVTAGAAPAVAQDDIAVRFADGRVTIEATNAPLSRVLAEWQRLGGTRFVNAERLPGTRVTVTLTDVPERQALAVLLRPFSGYMASPRPTEASTASLLSVVLVMPTLARASPPSAPASAVSRTPSQVQPRPMNRGLGRPGIQIGGDPDADTSDPDLDDDQQNMSGEQFPGRMGMPNYPGMPTVPPQDSPGDPAEAVPPSGFPPAAPGTPGSSTIPGMIVPATPLPGAGPPKLPPKPPGREGASLTLQP